MSTQTRQPAGSPVGGQFAASARAEADVSLTAGGDLDWRAQRLQVQGRRFTLGQVSGGRLLHGTRAKLEVGDVIEPGHARNHKQSPKAQVSITSVRSDAIYWGRKAAGDGPVYLYEIEPLGYVDPWNSGLAEHGTSFNLFEGRTARARIVAVEEW